MESFRARLASYDKPKRVKYTNDTGKQSTVTLKWPHKDIRATPELLAQAGFYWKPGAGGGEADNVCCFFCSKELREWGAQDDPFDIHWAKCGENQACAWAFLRCGLEHETDGHGNFTFSAADRLPSSKPMEKARLQTFTAIAQWPHDKTKGHTANSKKMAQAGFTYAPETAGDDTATCLYCSISLSGWEAGDDPLAEHRKREKKSGPCPFFSATMPASLSRSTASRAGSSKPPSRAGSARPPSRSARPTTLTIAESEGGSSPDELAPSAHSTRAPPKTPRTRKASTKAADEPATLRKSTRGQKRGAHVAESDLESVAEEPAPLRKSRARSVAPAPDPDSEDDPLETLLVPKTKGLARSRSQREPDDEDDEEQAKPAKPAKGLTRSKSRANLRDVAEPAPKKRGRPKSKAPAEEVSDASTAAPEPAPKKRGRPKAALSDAETVAPEPEPKTKGRGKSFARSKSKAALKEEEDAAEPEPEPEPKKKGRGKSLARPKSQAALKEEEAEEEEDVAEPEPEPEPKKKGRGKSMAPSKSKAALKEEEAVESESEPEPEPRKKGRGKSPAQSRSKPPPKEEDEDVAEAEPAPKPKKQGPTKSRARSRSKAPPEDEDEGEDVAQVEPEPKKKSRGKSLGRSKSKAALKESDLESIAESEAEPPEPKKKVRTKSKAAVRDDVGSDAAEPEPQAAKSRTKSLGRSRSKAASDAAEDAVPKKGARTKRTPSPFEADETVVLSKSTPSEDEPDPLNMDFDVDMDMESAFPPAEDEGAALKKSAREGKDAPAEEVPKKSTKGERTRADDPPRGPAKAEKPTKRDQAPRSGPAVTDPAEAPRRPAKADATRSKRAPDAEDAAPRERHTPSAPSTPPPRAKPASRAVEQVPAPLRQEDAGGPLPALATVAPARITSLTEAERSLTVEDWIRNEIEREYALLKADGERQIAAFRIRAAETRRLIEAM